MGTHPLLARARAAAVSRRWHLAVTAVVVADLAVVLAEVALSGVHPAVAACAKPPPAAEAAAEGLHAATLALLALINGEWVARALILTPRAYFSRASHWADAGLAVSALALEAALHGAAAVGTNLVLILLRLARVGHAFAELAADDAKARAAAATARERRRGAARAWRLVAAAAVATAKRRRREEGGLVVETV